MAKQPVVVIGALAATIVVGCFLLTNGTVPGDIAMLRKAKGELPKPKTSRRPPKPSGRPVVEEAVDGPCIDPYPNTTLHGKCQFKGCPHKFPYVYVLTSYRNRAAAYNRWLRTFAIDLKAKTTKFNPKCVCSVVADYNDAPWGPPVEEALKDWPFDKLVIKIPGDFSRAGGFQIAMDQAIKTPANNSLVFFMDADMVAYPGLIDRVLNHTRTGLAFAPVCWNQEYIESEKATDGWYSGDWRIYGTGMVSFMYSDFVQMTGHIHYDGRNPWNKTQAWKLEMPLPDGKTHIVEKGVIRNRCERILWHTYA